MKPIVCSALVAFLLTYFSANEARAFNGASFTGLGELPGGSIHSVAEGVSADGRVVVGFSGSATSVVAPFFWNRESGIQHLGAVPGGDGAGNAKAVSAAGDFIAGYGGLPAGYGVSFRWQSATGLAPLGGPTPSAPAGLAYGISDDGSVVAGNMYESTNGAGEQAYRWTASAGMQGLGDLPGGENHSSAFGISGDGQTIVGAGSTELGRVAMRWTSSGGMEALGELPGVPESEHNRSSAVAASFDGSVIVGRVRTGGWAQAFRWTENEGMVGLGFLDDSPRHSIAYDVSADGRVIVGSYGEEAFIWDAKHGMRRVYDVLTIQGSLDLTGWSLSSARGISADGRIVVGSATNPQGHSEAWMAVLPIPEPSGMTLAMIAGLIAAVFGWRKTRNGHPGDNERPPRNRRGSN